MKKWALLSVSNKEGIVSLAETLVQNGYGILSTGGTSQLLREAKIPVTDVASYTASAEIMDGRVKTLHPKIYAGILCNTENPQHLTDLAAIEAGLVDVVVVNFYPFAEQARARQLPIAQAIEYIDIGGPCMVRAAAKNSARCTVLVNPNDYVIVHEEIKQQGEISLATRVNLAAKAFATVSAYDRMISDYLSQEQGNQDDGTPHTIEPQITRIKTLRYGENPQQQAALCQFGSDNKGLLAAEVLQGKELSYNNYLDLDAAITLVAAINDKQPAVTIVKHTNPCGIARNRGSIAATFKAALAADPQSAFGGIVALNRAVDLDTAQALSEVFFECIAAPDFSQEARALLAKKANLRLLKVDIANYLLDVPDQLRSLTHGLLVQSADLSSDDSQAWVLKTTAAGNAKDLEELEFAMTIAKYVKSNAIVLTNNGVSIGVGAGQMSRIDALKAAIAKARDFGHELKNSYLASDAFFPFKDCVEMAASVGVKYIVQPGGSIRDQESIAAADALGLTMYFNSHRHFRH